MKKRKVCDESHRKNSIYQKYKRNVEALRVTNVSALLDVLVHSKHSHLVLWLLELKEQ